MTPLQWVVATRRRLWATAVGTGAVAFGLVPLVTAFVRDHSRSIGDDMLALTGWCLVALATSLCLAVLLGERLFTFGWRERVFLGRAVAPPESDDPLEPAVILKTHTGAFVGVWLATLVVLLGALEMASGGVFSEYQRVGRMRTLLRSDNHALKQEMLEEIADLREEEKVRAALPVIDMTWRDKKQPDDIQLAALRSLGRLNLSLVTSAASWRKAGTHEHWEMDLLRSIRTQIVPDLRVAFSEARGERKALLALALAKVRDHRSVSLLAEAARTGIEGADSDDEVARACLAGLGILHDSDALTALVELAPGLYERDSRTYEEMLERSADALSKNLDIQGVWGALTPEERRLVFRVWLMVGTGDATAAVEAHGMFASYLGALGERLPAGDVQGLARHLSALTRDGVLVDGATFTSLAYAVGETSRLYIPETDDAVDEYFGTLVEVFGELVGRGPLPRRCEAVDVLRKTGDARIAGVLTTLFDAPVSKGLCPSAYVDLGERAPEVMVTSELLRLRILRALALVAVGNEEVLAWARDRAAADDPRFSDYIRTQIRELLRLAEAKKG